MTGKLQKYADANLYDICRVVDAADRLYASVAEFPDDPACWADWIDALDMALESCPGTTAHYHKQHPTRDTDENPPQSLGPSVNCGEGIATHEQDRFDPLVFNCTKTRFRPTDADIRDALRASKDWDTRKMSTHNWRTLRVAAEESLALREKGVSKLVEDVETLPGYLDSAEDIQFSEDVVVRKEVLATIRQHQVIGTDSMATCRGCGSRLGHWHSDCCQASPSCSMWEVTEEDCEREK